MRDKLSATTASRSGQARLPTKTSSTGRTIASPTARKSPTQRGATGPQSIEVKTPAKRNATTNQPALRRNSPVPQRSTNASQETETRTASNAQVTRLSSSGALLESHEVRRLRGQLQGMKEQVRFMHKVMHDLSGSEKELLSDSHGSVASKRLSFAGISPVKKAPGNVNLVTMPLEKIPPDEQWQRAASLDHASSFLATSEFQEDGDQPDKETLHEGESKAKLLSMEQEINTLRAAVTQHQILEAQHRMQIEDLTAKCTALDSENLELHSHVQEFEEENRRLHRTLAALSNDNGARSNQGSTLPGDLVDELGIDGIGELTANAHERCETKIHELWQTIKTLKSYVETSRVEIEDLRVQRDSAVEAAERALEQNAKLAGNNNPQQKIKYLAILKNENAELVEKVRLLQSKLTRRKHKRLVRDVYDSASSEPLEEYPSSGDEPNSDTSDEERTLLLKTMWARNKKMEEEINRLRKEKQDLLARQSRTPSSDSRKSLSSSTHRWR